ncbi:MAG: hypothetical protein ACYSUT_00070 [Planctomycetota bacterium]|jgi:Rod binding domain-containing protein
MDIAKLTDSYSVLTSAIEKNAPAKTTEQKQKEKFAKDFESVIIGKLLDEMKNTIGQWGFEQDGAAEQVQGLFWMNLSQDLGQKGGMGLWKDIYNSLENPADQQAANETIDESL